MGGLFDDNDERAKKFRTNHALGMGDWRFFLSPKGIIQVEDLPDGWGLLWTEGKRILPIHGVPGNSLWCTAAPFQANKKAETQLLAQALRRVAIRGHFSDVYDSIA